MSVALVLVRHGQTDWNAAGRLQGRSDIELNTEGRAQAQAAGAALASEPWDVLVSSPLARAAETAKIIGEAIGVRPGFPVENLLERDYRAAEGQYLNGLTEPEFTHFFTGAESEAEVAARGMAALSALLHEHPGRRIIAVAHGTLIRLTMSTLLGRPHRRVLNGEVVAIDPVLVRSFQPV